jgi:histone H3/H4
MMTDQENQELAELITHVRKTWKDCRNSDSRRDYERRVHGINDDLMNQAIDLEWKRRYDTLADAYETAVEREAGIFRRTVSRVSVLASDARRAGRKTIKTDDLTLALSRCEVCERKDATHLWHNRPVCDADYKQLEEVT